jgi:hypothetical protein
MNTERMMDLVQQFREEISIIVEGGAIGRDDFRVRVNLAQQVGESIVDLALNYAKDLKYDSLNEGYIIVFDLIADILESICNTVRLNKM